MKSISTVEDLKKLYEEDFYLWVEETTRLLKEGRYDLIDWEHLIEEIESMSRSEKDSIESHLSVALEHIYKLDHLRQYSHYDSSADIEGGWGWKKSVINACREIDKRIKKNPSLLQYIGDLLPGAWEDARKGIIGFINHLGISMEVPEELPYTIEELADKITETTGVEGAIHKYYRK